MNTKKPRPRRSYDMTNRAAAAAQTREKILVEAFELFCAESYDAVTLPRVAALAGVSTQTVVLHIGSKEGLVRALIEYRRPRESAAREVPVGDVVAAAKIVCERYDEMGPAVLRLLAIEDRLEAARLVVKSGREAHREWVEKTFGPVIRERGATRERRIMGLVAAYDLYTWSVLRRVLDSEETALAMADLARGALGIR